MPKILFSGKRYFAYEFIKGTYFKDWLENPFYKEKILTQIILACYKLDRKGVAKEEMHRPLKHIIIKENKIKMIDFERTHKTKKPKNVTQFLQCLRSRRKQLKLRITAEEISKIAQDYTHERKIQNVIHRVLR